MKKAPRINPALVNDLTMTLFLIGVLALMILPLPTPLIDALLAINLTISIVILMVTLFTPSAIALSTFPSILLFTTLFRLGLNIASTKSILLHADAGHLIESFGQLVVGGNLVVGIVVFVVITIVQLVVISKGSERVAEVGARFTLDALPGKQMSIDADLRSGLLTLEEAKRKRGELAMESQLHGGMDGAMKFVKGDSIAGLITTIVNLVAGIAVGVMYHGMTAAEAANRFAVLSIGDAMVSQIPSLLICMAAGIIITRVADDRRTKPTSLGQDISEQLSRNPRALNLSAALTFGFGVVPGFPLVPFLMLSLLLVFGGHVLSKRRGGSTDGVPTGQLAALMREGGRGDAPVIQRRVSSLTRPLAIRLSPALASLIDTDALSEAMEAERHLLQARLGLPFPGAAIWIESSLTDLAFDVLINDVPTVSVRIPGRMWLCRIRPAPPITGAVSLPLCDGREPVVWAPAAHPAVSSGEAGYLSVEQVVAEEVLLAVSNSAHSFVGIQEVQWIIERISQDYPGLVLEVQKVMPLQRIAEVLRRLLEEQVPIRNMRSIFESLITWGPKEKDLLMLTEYVRTDLGRYLAHEASAGRGHVEVILLDQTVEQHIRGCIKPTPAGNYLAMPPDEANEITARILAAAGSEPRSGVALVTSMDIRRYVKKLIERRLGWIKVYSYQELANQVELKTLARIS